MVTSTAAQIAGLAGQLGSLEQGRPADLMDQQPGSGQRCTFSGSGRMRSKREACDDQTLVFGLMSSFLARDSVPMATPFRSVFRVTVRRA
jgi:hypothetical protein